MKKIVSIMVFGLASQLFGQDPDNSTSTSSLEPPIATPAPQAPVVPEAKAKASTPDYVPDLSPGKISESSNIETFGGAGDNGQSLYGDGDSYKVEAENKGGSDSRPDVYTIESGDTLWDVCGKMLDNPYYWPKLWSMNEYITNPHVISPGKQLRFFAGSSTSFPKMDVLDPNATQKVASVGPSGETMNVERSIAQTGGSRDLDVRLNMVSLLSEKEIKPLGRIANSVAPKMELTFGDYLYIKFYKTSQVSVGDKFHVIHRMGQITPPGSKFGSLGSMIRKAAVLQVTKVTNQAIEARVTDSYEAIERNDEFVAYSPQIRTIAPTVADAQLKGQIVASDRQLTMVGSHDFVYLNIGSKQGVKDGQRLVVVKQGDGLPLMYRDDESLPDVVIGKLMVVDTYEKTSMAYILSIDEELQVGSRVRGAIE